MAERFAAVSDRLRAVVGTDDAPLWAEVAAVVLAGALVVRAGAHAWVALLASDPGPFDIDPTICREHDLTLRSPVVALRDHRVEPVARGVTALLGFGGLELHATGTATGGAEVVAALWLTVQFGALAADPLAMLLNRTIQMTDNR